MMIKSKQISDYFIWLICLFTISTLTQNIFPLSINRVLAGVTFLLILLDNCRRISRKMLLFYIYLLFLLLYTSFRAENLRVNLNDWLYYAISLSELLWLSQAGKMQQLSNAFQRNNRVAKITVLVAAAVVIVSLLSPSSYIQNWGGSSYFKGFTDSSHAAASSCCLALCLAVFAFNEKKYEILKYILLGIFSATIFATGARVFLIPLGIILVYCVRADTNKKAVRIGIYFVGFLLAVALFIKTGMINKFIYVIEDPFGQSSSFFESFTSGRSKFWWVDLKDYFNSDLLCMITGHGFDYIYQLNLRSVGMEIWAHNDFINILVGAGIIGLSVYLGILYRGYKKILKSESGMVKFLLVIYVLFPAFFNGFYIYYHFLNSFIIFLVGIQYVNNRKQKKACGENIYG